MRPRVFDSWAIFAFLLEEPAARQVESALGDCQDSGRPALISVINLGEVWYQIARKTSAERADRTTARLLEAGLKSEPVDWELARAAAVFKAKYRLSFADCCAAALAIRHRAELLTGDPEFRQLEKELKIRWLRPK